MDQEQQKQLLRDVLRGVAELAEAMKLPPTEALKKARDMVIALRELRASKEAESCPQS